MKTTLLIDPEWIPLFLMSYIVAYFVFDRTDNLVYATITFLVWNIASIAVVYWYYGAI